MYNIVENDEYMSLLEYTVYVHGYYYTTAVPVGEQFVRNFERCVPQLHAHNCSMVARKQT